MTTSDASHTNKSFKFFLSDLFCIQKSKEEIDRDGKLMR
jgi:hypothetical protein